VISVGAGDEDESVTFRCPYCVEFVAGVTDATGEAAFGYEFGCGEQVFRFCAGLCVLDEQVRLRVFDPFVPVTNGKLVVDADAILLRFRSAADLLVASSSAAPG
jgi:hypothetical protein